MNIKKRLQFLECQAKPVTATEAGTSEAARALADIKRLMPQILAERAADPEAAETRRRVWLAALGFGADEEPEVGEILRRIVDRR